MKVITSKENRRRRKGMSEKRRMIESNVKPDIGIRDGFIRIRDGFI